MLETQILRAVKMSDVLALFELDEDEYQRVRSAMYDICGATPEVAALHTLMGNHQFLVEMLDSLAVFDVELRTEIEKKFWGAVSDKDYVDIER